MIALGCQVDQMSIKYRVFVGVLVAPLISVPLLIGYRVVFDLLSGDEPSLLLLGQEMQATFVVSYAGMILVGLPVHLIFSSRGVKSLRAYLIASIVGAGVVAILLSTSTGSFAPIAIAYGTAFFSVFSAAVALLFWILAVRGGAPNKPNQADVLDARRCL